MANQIIPRRSLTVPCSALLCGTVPFQNGLTVNPVVGKMVGYRYCTSFTPMLFHSCVKVKREEGKSEQFKGTPQPMGCAFSALAAQPSGAICRGNGPR